MDIKKSFYTVQEIVEHYSLLKNYKVRLWTIYILLMGIFWQSSVEAYCDFYNKIIQLPSAFSSETIIGFIIVSLFNIIISEDAQLINYDLDYFIKNNNEFNISWYIYIVITCKVNKNNKLFMLQIISPLILWKM